jgi:hypothetical protein
VAKVSINGPKTPVTEGSSGIASATMPNVCKMPGPPAPFVPTPLPNIGKSGMSPKGYSKKVTIEGKAVAIAGASFGSMGDVASKGLGGGMVSMNCEGPTKFVGPGAMNVQIEGKNVQLLGDPMLNNCGPSGSPPNSATMTGVVQPSGDMLILYGDDRPCPLCTARNNGEATYHEGIPANQAIRDDLRRLFDGLKRELAGQRGDIVRLSQLRAAGNRVAADTLEADLGARAVLKLTGRGGTFSRGYMVGVVVCKCGAKKLAAMSGALPTPGFATVAANAGFTVVSSATRPPPGPDENPMAGWQCAARQLFGSLDSHEPTQMCERWFAPHIRGLSTADSTPRVTVVYWIQRLTRGTRMVGHQFKYGQTVPSCSKCQANLPRMVCNNKCKA